MKLKLKDAKIVKLTKYPGENGTTQVLEVAANLTPSLADQFRCREACYTDEGIPRHFEAYPSPDLRIIGADVTLGVLPARANLIHKFKISQPKTGGNTDVTLDVQIKMHFEGKIPIGIWADDQNKTAFLLSINARQEDLTFGDGDAAEEEHLDTGCVACNNRIPMGDLPGRIHASGAPCTAREGTADTAAAGDAAVPGAIANAREAAGGTPHQRRRSAGKEQ